MSRRKKAPKKSHIGVVQDKSGSMGTRYIETISGYNQFIDTLREQAEGPTFVTLVQFDTYKVSVYEQKPLADVPRLDESTYVLGGMTALLDGVGEAIRRMEKFVRKGDNVAITIMTDGGENSSREFTTGSVTALMDRKREEGWEFNFLGAGPSAWGGAQVLGIGHAHVINYAGDGHSHGVAFRAAALSNVAKTRGMSSSYAESTPLLKAQLEGEAAPDVQINIAHGAGGLLGVRPRKRGSGKNLK